ncbi:hypothetical protein FACS189499_04470 [Clostridia bacterium]|nr:hypothetical protein FACS189499_04470 [Clostridia bacterium]
MLIVKPKKLTSDDTAITETVLFQAVDSVSGDIAAEVTALFSPFESFMKISGTENANRELKDFIVRSALFYGMNRGIKTAYFEPESIDLGFSNGLNIEIFMTACRDRK